MCTRLVTETSDDQYPFRHGHVHFQPRLSGVCSGNADPLGNHHPSALDDYDSETCLGSNISTSRYTFSKKGISVYFPLDLTLGTVSL